MLGIEYTITNQGGTLFKLNDHITDPLNFVALQQYPSFDLQIRNAETPKDGQHGIWDFNSFYGKRTILFNGVIIGTTEQKVIEQRDKIIEVTKLPSQPTITDNGTVTITFTDSRSRAIQITAKLQSPIRFRRNIKENYRLDFQMVLKSTDIVFESQVLTKTSGVRGYEMGSVRLPTLLSTQLDLVAEQEVAVTNGGNTESDLKVRLYSDVGGTVNPVIKNNTTQKFMRILITMSDPSQYVEIDSKAGTVKDQSGNDLSALIGDGSTFVTLDVGLNNLLYLSQENDNIGTSPLVTRIAPTAGIIETEHRDAIS